MRLRNILLSVLFVLMFSSSSYPVDYIAGVKSGFYVWEPYIKDIDASGFAQIDKGSGILYGPVFSALFTQDLSFSIALLTGTQSTYWSPRHEAFETTFLTGTYYFESKRVDVDAAISYRILPNIKAFIGYKYQYIKSKLSYTELRTAANNDISDINLLDSDLKTPSQGAALGAGFSYPFGKGFFITANISGLYMTGTFELSDNLSFGYSSFTNLNISPNSKFKLDTRQLGLNFEPSIGFSADNGLIFTLGFRYQWLKTEYLDDFPGMGMPLPDASDYLYGAFVSVLYAI